MYEWSLSSLCHVISLSLSIYILIALFLYTYLNPDITKPENQNLLNSNKHATLNDSSLRSLDQQTTWPFITPCSPCYECITKINDSLRKRSHNSPIKMAYTPQALECVHCARRNVLSMIIIFQARLQYPFLRCSGCHSTAASNSTVFFPI